MTKTYIIAQRHGMQNGRCLRYRDIFRVGANNLKQAMNYVHQQIKPSDSYKLLRIENTYTPKGSVISIYNATRAKPVIIEIEGINYLQTEEYDEVNAKFKYVAINSRSNNPMVKWL